MLSALLLTVSSTSPLLQPFEDLLNQLSVGPVVGANAVVDRSGVAPAFTAGAQLTWFDVEKIPEPRCAEHRRAEREQLGGGDAPVWDELLQGAQQPCPSIDEKVSLSTSIGLEVEVVARARRELSIRAFGSSVPLVYRTVSLGFTGATTLTESATGTVVGFRAGAELAWHLRLGKGTWHPLIIPFARGEAVLLRRDVLADQASAGVRVLVDL